MTDITEAFLATKAALKIRRRQRVESATLRDEPIPKITTCGNAGVSHPRPGQTADAHQRESADA
ncbi:MAG: hypothetical protein COY40_06730 [Alphaproteobacteria bacterium CG_4_10_14_0_8_um_filter_53_9]|nr:MAG: hypothetical protein COY40_06730 [Alphaproteobacteria bacterium CG_4_10_14_0_8_um_filter_53_9]